MMHRARSSIVEVPYCFSRSSVKFQGHTALKIVEFDPKWAFPDCNSSLNSPMAMKCCTKFETAKERCPIVFQGHPSNFKVTRFKTSPILTQIGRFRTIGQSQLSNPSDLPCCLTDVNFDLKISWFCKASSYHHIYQIKENWRKCVYQCYPKSKMLGRPKGHPWGMVGWSMLPFGGPYMMWSEMMIKHQNLTEIH